MHLPMRVVQLPVALGTFSAGGAVNISMGSGSGDLTLTDFETSSTFVIEASNFGGTIDVSKSTAAGNTTVSIGEAGHFSASVINTLGSFTLDGANAATSLMTINTLSAAGGVVVSMGAGSGGATLGAAGSGKDFIIDGAIPMEQLL